MGLGHEDLEVLDRDSAGAGGQGIGRQVGELGDQLAHLGQGSIEFLEPDLHGLVEALGLVNGEPVVLHQLVDIQTVAGRGGDAPRGSVGLLQKTQAGELRHLIAHGGRGEVHIRHGGDGFGADGLGRADIAVHDGAQDFLFSV